MTTTPWTEADTKKAQQFWSEYQQKHNLADRQGETAGIDPATGHIWFGQSASDIVAKLDAEGSTVSLYFVRVGFNTYLRKGGRR